MLRKKLFFLTFLLLLLGGGQLWAETYTWDLSANSGKATSNTNDIVTIAFGGSNISAQRTFMGFKNGSIMSVSCTPGYTITQIKVSYASDYLPKSESFAASSGVINNECTQWTGSESNITITNTTTSNDTHITNVTVTYTNTSEGDVTQGINIADLRFEHQTYNPSRSGVAGFDITTSGWQSYTTVSGDDRIYTLLLSNTGSSNSITIAPNSTDNSGKKIKRVILFGAGGSTTFDNATVTSSNTRKYSDESSNVAALIWESTSGESSATISINSSDRPHIYYIEIVTDAAMSWSKQNVVLSFDPNTGSADKDLTDFSIDGRVKATIGSGTAEYFRPDEFNESSVTNSGSNASFNQFHISTGKVGINTGNTTGTATITASFAGNAFYNAATSVATSGTYTLTITDNTTHSVAVSVDDMRISKKVDSNGLNAASYNLDRDNLGGFKFEFTGDEGVKFNNGDFLIFRNSSGSNGKVKISPVKNDNSKTVTITRVDISTLAAYTDGTVKANNVSDISLTNVSSYSFTGLTGESFTLEAQEGNVYITEFTIYYTDAEGTLNTAKTTPSITLSKYSDTVNSNAPYSSPTISSTTPKNFDFTITSDNINVATVASTNWGSGSTSLVSLQGNEGTAVITASAAESTFFNAATSVAYTVTVSSTNSKKWDFTTLDLTNTINDTEWKKNGDPYLNQFTTQATTKDAEFNAESTIPSTKAYYTTPNTNSQVYELLFGRQNSSGLSTGQIRLFSNYMTFNNSAVVVAVPVTAGQSVMVTFDGGNGSSPQGFDFTNATLQGDEIATSFSSDETQKTVTLIASADGYVTLKASASKVRLYSIEIKDETRATLTFADTSNNYERSVGEDPNDPSKDNHFNHRVKFTPSDGAENALTYEGDGMEPNLHLHITSSDNNVLDVTKAYVSQTYFGTSSSFYFNNIVPKGAGTATLTITFDGNNGYKPTSYTSRVYTVSGALGSIAVKADDQAIQQGQRSPIDPVITNTNGQPIGIRGTAGAYETYVLGDEEDLPDYSTYFNFLYEAGSGTGTNYTNITVDEFGTISTTEDTGIGATRNIAVTATVKDDYQSAFGNNSVTANTTMTVTVRAKNAGVNPCRYYWNKDLTSNEVTGPGTDKDFNVTEGSSMGVFGQSGTFASGFPNGRMMYVKPNNAEDVIFFSYAENAEPSDFPAQPKLDKDKKHYIYRRGIPIYIDDDLKPGDYVRVNVATASYDASTKKYTLNSSVVKMKFFITSHQRPAQPTYDPISPDATASLNKDGRKIMNTSQNVVAYGEGASKGVTGYNNLVYGKFSTSSIYTTAQLINEETVSSRLDNVPVVSTEVNKRRFTAVQIKNYTDGEVDGYGDYISEQTYTEYYYLYDTDLRLSPAEGESSINYNITPSKAIPNVPQNYVTWYNKRNYKNSNATGVTQEVDSYDGKISYAITGTYNLTEGTDVSIDPTTGIVTSSTEKQGWVKVTVTYTGGEEHGGKSGEPQYVSTTDKSTADFYVYFYDMTKERPTITPSTRNFTGKMTYTITAPENWDVVYTTDGSDPVVPDYPTTPSNYIAHTAHQDKVIGLSGTTGVEIAMSINDVHTVKAIAYTYTGDNHDKTYSAVVSESYTLKAPLPDPVFDPDGTDKDGDGTLDYYSYNTNTLTVQIACAYAGSEIYYTIDGTDPEIGASNTYKYSGLSKVIISGNVVIRAVAYDPVNRIFSHVVPSEYRYSDTMVKPYFQISNDGESWYGFPSSGENLTLNGTEWSTGQSWNITPSTLIRIIDPNPVTGTICYTLDGSTTPTNDASSFVYTEGYPFTLGKTTLGKAIVILDDAKSEVSTANFNITGHNVWEAVDETMTYLNGKHGIFKSTSKTVNESTINKTKTKDSGESLTTADGFVISTNKDLYVTNTESNVNLYSIDTGNGGTATKMYAQAYITATFGGCVPKDDNDESKVKSLDWTEMTIADAAIGTPIDGVGTYSIKNDDNAQMEIKSTDRPKKDTYNYNHVNSLLTDVHDRTFKIPSRGSYVRFEPEKDGDLTIWVLQQGAVHYEEDEYFIDRYIRMKPVYMVDEQGKSYQVKTINGVPQLWSSARLSTNWTRLQEVAAENGGAGGWANYDRNDGNKLVGDYIYLNYLTGEVTTSEPSDFENNSGTKKSDNKKYKRMENKGPNRAESQTLYNLYKAYLDKNHVSVGDPIKPFAIHTGTAISQNNGNYNDSSNDGTGYVLVSGGYAKYTFEVKAGKTYYFFATGSKVGVRGFQFVPTEVTNHAVTITPGETTTTYTVDGVAKTLAETKTACADKPVNVTLKRTFKKDTWTSLVLPFSVSTTQLDKLFGNGTVGPEVLHFLDVTQSGVHWRLRLMQHYHQMLVAGTPVLIKPAKDVTDPVFEGVQIEADAVTPMTVGNYTMTGTFVNTEASAGLQSGDYFMANSGKFMRWTGVDTAMRGTYAWLHPDTQEAAARVLDFSFEDYEGVTTGIIEVEIPAGSTTFDGIKDGAVYDLNGRKVSQSRFTNLPKGVYIVNGKKMIID